MGLRARLVLSAAYLLLLVIVALEIPFALTVESRETKQLESSLLQNAALVAGRINDDVPNAGTDPAVPPRPDAAIGRITDAIALASSREGEPARFIVVDRLGRVLADSDSQAAVGTPYATPDRPEFGRVFSVSGGVIDVERRFSSSLNQTLLLVTVPVIHDQQAIGAVRASTSLDALRRKVHRIWLGLALIGAAVILVGLGLSWFLATTVARPVRRLEEAAARVGAGDLDARAPERGPKEVATLARSFNRMAGSLSANMEAQQEFMANASHQLRTPLTGLKLRLEAIESEGGFAAQQAQRAGGEVDRLALLVGDLLQIARASSVEGVGSPQDLGAVARHAVDRWTEPATAAGKQLELRAAGAATVWADEADLNHVVDNLLENAIRYCPQGTRITVEADRRDGSALLAVSDTGPGIPAEERERVFQRFFRGTSGRQAGPGTGLGLAIVFELVRRWGGDVRLAEGPGTRFEAVFPPPPTLP